MIVADPPYDVGTHHHRRGCRRAGYVRFTGREWWREAWAVLRPAGSLYVVCAISELHAWLDEASAPPVDIIAWHTTRWFAWKAHVPGRATAWRPIVHWQKAPRVPFPRPAPPNVVTLAPIQTGDREALPWPNQLPVRLVRWLLEPHTGACVLDLFSGTGTTRETAIGLGLEVVSVDLAPEAVDLVRRRPAQPPLPMVSGRS